MAELEVKQIRLDGGTQARAGIDRETVREYMDVLQESDSTWPFPSVIVFYDGKEYWLADGFHRLTAARQHGRFVCEADIRQGTQRDAVLFAAGANADHGLRRTAEDKRRAVLRLLEDTEWGKWSDREIARRCKVSHPFVAKIREDTGNVSSERVFSDRHGNITVMDTTNIGKKLPGPEDIQAAIVRFVNSQDDWPELAGKVFTTPLHNLRSYGEEPFDYFDRVRAELENGEGVANEAIRAAAREVWADRRFQSLADKDGRLPPRCCPRCQAEGISDLVGDDHWRCSNCGREYDSTGRVPSQPDGSDDYSHTEEIEGFVKQVETAVSKPIVEQILEDVDCYESETRQLADGENDDQESIFNSLKSMEWLIEEMMTQVESRPLLFALNEAVMAVRKAVDVAKELETAVSEEV